jgi:hypothetical protein
MNYDIKTRILEKFLILAVLVVWIVIELWK